MCLHGAIKSSIDFRAKMSVSVGGHMEGGVRKERKGDEGGMGGERSNRKKSTGGGRERYFSLGDRPL